MDTNVVAGLKAALADENIWLERSTLAVVVGVVVEMGDLLFFNKEMGRVQRAILFAATVAIASGCGGEWYFEHKAKSLEAHLQQISDEKVAGLAAAEAADKKIAQQAAKSAADLGMKVDALPSFVATKEAELSGLADRMNRDKAALASARADALTAANRAEAQVAESRAAIEGVRAAIAPRTLSAAQKAEIATSLRSWATLPGAPTRQSVNVFSTSGTFESSVFADQIASALGPDGAGWTVDRSPVTYGKSYAVSGVGLLVAAGDRARRVAADLVSALRKAGVSASIIPDESINCAKLGSSPAHTEDNDPACSAISVEVGDHP